MTDVGGGIFSLAVTAVFLRFWKPRNEWHFAKKASVAPPDVDKLSCPQAAEGATLLVASPSGDKRSGEYAAEAAALLAPAPTGAGGGEKPLTVGRVALAWAPFAIMSVMLLLSGLVRGAEGDGDGRVGFGPVRTNYKLPVPWLHRECDRDCYLHAVKREQLAVLSLADQKPWTAALVANDALKDGRLYPLPEKAEFNVNWVTVPGTPVLAAALLSMLMVRMRWKDVGAVFNRTCVQMKIPIPTIAFMLGLSYVTRYSGMDATLGVTFSYTFAAYPFFAAMLGWLGVFLTGTDAGSNALFGSLQKITATQIHNAGVLPQLTLPQAQLLICTANSTGGVMGKMIDAQSIVVATAATNQIGREADIFRRVIWHSIALASVVGLLTLLQAYVWPFTLMVPHPP
jgi:lactate permease